jgi:hypothetical protein
VDDQTRPENFAEPFQIMRRWTLYAGTGVVSVLLAVAVAAVASTQGPAWLWVLAAALLVVGAVALPGVADRETPLFVADSHGVRLRDHGNWVGLLWSEIAQIVVEPRTGTQDPRVKVVTTDGRRVYSTPVGFATDVPVADAEVQLARRRATNAY